MRLHRFFVRESLKNKQSISIFDKELLHQWKNVFRLASGDKVILLDDTGYEYHAQFTLLSKEKAELDIAEQKLSDNIPEKELWLFAALIKKDNFEWIIEKATELGVSHIVPILTERSEKKNLNMERAQKIVTEASEQSGRGIRPQLHPVTDLGDITTSDIREQLGFETVPLVVFDVKGEKFVPSAAQNLFQDNKLGIFVGPEGGWSEKELETFMLHKMPTYTLGSKVLRAETAVIAIASLLML
jgi:16S rRNA (uracil1498-N3)-methyltransferase